jgi:signal transduction histidine kinase
MYKTKENDDSIIRGDQLEQMLRLYMHEVSQITAAINIAMRQATRELDKYDESISTIKEGASDIPLQKNIERTFNDIRDMLKMMDLLKNNIRIGMNLSQAYGEQSDVHIYRDIIFKLIDIYQHELRSKNLAFITPAITFTDDVKMSFKTSKNLLELVLYNIVNNAVKFSHKGTNIYIECKQVFTESGIRTITVIDYGAYIEESDKPYELYYRGVESALLTEGIGLGLFVANKSMERLGGRIQHCCKKVSDYYVPYIEEYLSRQVFESADEYLINALRDEMNLLKQNDCYNRIVSYQRFKDISNMEIRSCICIPTYETSFEVEI